MDRTNFTPEAKWGTGDVAAPNISDVLLGRTPAPCCVQLAKQNGTSPPFSPRGSTFGFTANVSLIPSLRSGVALVNRKRADPLGKTIGRRVLQALTGAQTQAARTSLPRAAALNPHAGRSTSKAGNVWVEVQRSGRRLSTFKAPLQGTGRGRKQTLALAGPLGNLAHPLGNAVLGQWSVPHS